MGPPPFQKKIPKKSQFFSDKEILDSARPPSPPFGVFLKKKTVFFYASPYESKFNTSKQAFEMNLLLSYELLTLRDDEVEGLVPWRHGTPIADKVCC